MPARESKGAARDALNVDAVLLIAVLAMTPGYLLTYVASSSSSNSRGFSCAAVMSS